jgi:glycine hydroxymethyltransferase
MREREMRLVAGWVARALEHRSDDRALARIRGEVLELAESFPLYGWLRQPEPVAV